MAKLVLFVRRKHRYFHTIWAFICCVITDLKINLIFVKVRYFVEYTRQAMFL